MVWLILEAPPARVNHGLRYPLAMVPPCRPDEHGRPIPTYPCSRCGREVAVRFRGFRVHLRHVDWRVYRVAGYVNWCGRSQEVIPVPRPDGLVALVVGEAT
jgi:hypothetical protein